MRFAIPRVEFGHCHGLPEGAVSALDTLVDVPIIAVPVESGKIKRDHSALRINEDGGVTGRMAGVDPFAQVNRQLPVEIVVRIAAKGGVNLNVVFDVQTAIRKEQPVAVWRQFRRELTRGSVDVRPQILRRRPIGISIWPLRYPKVEFTEAAGAIRDEENRQQIR